MESGSGDAIVGESRRELLGGDDMIDNARQPSWRLNLEEFRLPERESDNRHSTFNIRRLIRNKSMCVPTLLCVCAECLFILWIFIIHSQILEFLWRILGELCQKLANKSYEWCINKHSFSSRHAADTNMLKNRNNSGSKSPFFGFFFPVLSPLNFFNGDLNMSFCYAFLFCFSIFQCDSDDDSVIFDSDDNFEMLVIFCFRSPTAATKNWQSKLSIFTIVWKTAATSK